MTPTATVVDVAWDDSLGGRNFDENLQQHLLKVATKDSKLDIKSNVRSMERLRAEARRVKEVCFCFCFCFCFLKTLILGTFGQHGH
jgi:hypothetical protein